MEPRPSQTTPAEAGPAIAVGWVSTVAGGTLLLAPDAVARLLQLDDPRTVRLAGALDLAVAPGLVLGPTRWPWFVGRIGVNAAIVAMVGGSRADRPRPRIVARALVGVSVLDVVATVRLARAELRG